MEVISLYEMEVSPLDILNVMKDNIYDINENQNIINNNKTYIIKRKSLISLIYKISNKMGFKSQTFFLAVNYMDIIFTKEPNQFQYNYNILAVACLIVASKYCENVPLRPIFKHYIILYNNEIKDNNHKINKDILFKYEIIICKMLNYKLNYFTIYDFNFFFFGSGIIKIEQLKEIVQDISYTNNESKHSSTNVNSSIHIKKILIKIYEKSRHYLDAIIENLICLEYNSFLISIYIMEKSVDYVLLKEFNHFHGEDSIDIKSCKYKNKKYFKQIMRDFYKIDYESLPEYENLKSYFQNYKLFDNIYKNYHIKNSNSNNLVYNSSSPKGFKINSNKSNNIKINNNNETKDNINYLYRKVNIQINNNNIQNINQRDNNSLFKSNYNIKNKKSNILTTLDNIKYKNKFRNSNSNDKNYSKNYTSVSPIKKPTSKKIKHTNKKSQIINNKKIIDDSKEKIRINSKSIDKKINEIKVNINNLNNSKIKIKSNASKPYVKKIVHNLDGTQEDNIRFRDKKNINININISNKILYEGNAKNKEKNKSSKKILNKNFLNKSNNSMIRGKNLDNKSKSKNNQNNYEFIPYMQKDVSKPISKNNYIQNKFNKKISNINDILKDKNYLKEFDNSNINNNKSPIFNNNKSPIFNTKQNYKKANYNIYNSTSITSRNESQHPIHKTKLTDSLINIKMKYLKKDEKNDKVNKAISNSIINYIQLIKNNKQNDYINEFSLLNIFKTKNSPFLKKDDSSYKNINEKKEINYIKSYNNKNHKYSTDIDNNINIKEFNLNNIFMDNKIEKTDRRPNISNINLLDISTLSNENI